MSIPGSTEQSRQAMAPAMLPLRWMLALALMLLVATTAPLAVLADRLI